MVNEKKTSSHIVQTLLFSPTLTFFSLLYSNHSFTFVYTTHLCSVQERLHEIYSRVGWHSVHHNYFETSRNTNLTLAHICTVHFPSRVRRFSLFLCDTQGCEDEEIVYSACPVNLKSLLQAAVCTG
jgi:hypothetical protein